ncbi:hypothetical protein GN956_G26771 [Arapaima gigas]
MVFSATLFPTPLSPTNTSLRSPDVGNTPAFRGKTPAWEQKIRSRKSATADTCSMSRDETNSAAKTQENAEGAMSCKEVCGAVTPVPHLPITQ